MSFEVKNFVESPTYEQLVKLKKTELVSDAQNLGIGVKQSDRKDKCYSILLNIL